MWRCRAGGGAEKLGKGRNKSDRRKEGKYARRPATMRIYEGYIEYEEQIFIKSNQYCIRNYNLYLSLNPAGRVLRISSKYYTICDHLSSPPVLSYILHRTIWPVLFTEASCQHYHAPVASFHPIHSGGTRYQTHPG